MIDVTVIVWLGLTFSLGAIVERMKKKKGNYYLDC